MIYFRANGTPHKTTEAHVSNYQRVAYSSEAIKETFGRKLGEEYEMMRDRHEVRAPAARLLPASAGAA